MTAPQQALPHRSDPRPADTEDLRAGALTPTPARPRLGKATLVALTLLAFALVALGVATWQLMARDRAALVERFARDRLKQLTVGAREVKDDLEDVTQDLLFSGRLLQASSSADEQQRVLSALLGLVRPYRAAGLYSCRGEALTIVVDPRAAASVPRGLRAAMRETVRRAIDRPPGPIVTSLPVETPTGGWARAFALRLSAAPSASTTCAVALLVDTQPFLEKLRLVAADPESSLLVLGPHGHCVHPSDPRLRRVVDAAWPGEPAGVLGFVVRRMRAGAAGTATVDRATAQRLGLEATDLVAAHAPIRIRNSAPWSAAVLASTSALRALERGMMWRLGLGSAGIAVILVVFGSYIVASTRRAAVLRERLRHAHELAHAHEKADKILENIPTGVIALSEEGCITAMNRALRRRIATQAVGEPLARAFPLAPVATVDRVQELVAAALASGSTQRIRGEPLALFGEEGQYSVHAVPLAHPLGGARVLLVLEDFTEVRALESQLLRAEKLATVGVLAAGVAHEIGTPLGVVRGRAEYLLGKLGADHREAGGLRVIMEQIDRVTRTIRELLDFSRIKPAAVAPLDLAPTAARVAELLRYEVGRRQVSIDVQVPDGLPLLLAHADQLQQVLVNLLINACDASAPGGVVQLTASVAAGAVTLVIADEGCGIPADDLHRIFDPFFTTKKRGQGTGLGLTIVSQIVRNHGAQIEIHSTPGRGTRAVLTWPTAVSRGADDGR